MKNKKIVIFLLIMLFSFILVKGKTIYANIEDVYANIQINKEEVLTAEYIDLTVSIHNLATIPEEEDGITVLMLNVYYDSSKFELPYANINKQNIATISDDVKTLSQITQSLGLKTNDIICHVDLNNPDILSIQIIYSMAYDTLKEDGDIFTIKFKAKDKVSGNASFYIVEEESIIITSLSALELSIYNEEVRADVEVISTDVTIKELYVVSLDNDLEYHAKYKSGRFEILVPYGTSEVDVVVITESDVATFNMVGQGKLVNSTGSFKITVTAQDGVTSKTYDLLVRPAKNINTLMDVVLSDGDFIDETGVVIGNTFKFSNDETQYQLKISYTNSPTLVFHVTQASGAKIYHNGEEITTLNLSGLVPLEETIIELDVKAEDNSIRNYEITIVMELAENDTSLEFVSSNFEAEITQVDNTYTLKYPYSINNKVKLILKPTSGSTTLEFIDSPNKFSKINDEFISNDIEIFPPLAYKIFKVKATAKNGDTEEYTFKLFLDEADSRTGLTNIYIDGKELSNFSKDVYNYDLGIIPISVNELVVTVDKESEKSGVVIKGADELSVGTGIIVISVSSEEPLYGEAQKTTHYILTYTRNLINANHNIKTIKVNGIALDFDKTKTVYDLTYTYNVNVVVVDVDLEDDSKDASITGNVGYQNLVIGLNKLLITVTSNDGANSETYELNITRLSPSIDTGIKRLLVDHIELDKVNGEYYLEVDYSVNKIYLDAELNDENATLSGYGWQILDVGENKFDLKVTSSEKTHFSEYEIVVVRKAPSSSSYLSELSIVEADLKDFDKDQHTYSINVNWEFTSVTIIARTEDSKAKILQSGNNYYEFKKDLSIGNNQVLIDIEAEDGSTTYYSLIIYRAPKLNDNSTLKELVIEGYDAFNLAEQETEIKNFNLIVPYDQETIKVKAIPTSDKSVVFGATNHVLNVGLNQIDIYCFAENDTYTIYRIFVFREALSSNNYIDKMTIEEKDNFVFNKLVESYILFFDKKIEKLNLSIVLSDNTAKYKVTGNNDFKSGINTVEIIVTAPDESVRTYTIFVNIDDDKAVGPWAYILASMGVINIGIVAFAIIQRKKLKL